MARVDGQSLTSTTLLWLFAAAIGFCFIDILRITVDDEPI